jgi:hypothetical protein
VAIQDRYYSTKGNVMIVSDKARIGRGLAAAVFVSTGIAAGLSGLTGTAHAQTQASAQGETCVFDAPSGLDMTGAGITRAGHIGWGYKVPDTDQYIYGATEGIKNTDIRRLDTTKKIWHEQGNRAKMFAAFHSGSHYMHPGYYTAAKCTTTTNSSVDAANRAVKDVESENWFLVSSPISGGNCMDDTYKILTAYGAGLPSPLTHWFPNNWFDSIGWEKTAV